MKLFLPPLFLFALSGLAPDDEELVFAPEEGTTLKRSFEAQADYEPAELSVTLDGNELEVEQQVPVTLHFVERIVVRDAIEGVEDGRPTELVRTFLELAQDYTFSSEGEDGEQSATSELEQRSVRFSWDAEEEDYSVEVADDGDELDEDLLEYLREDMDLRGLLPEGEVAEGDEWEFDPTVYVAFMWPSGLLDFRTADEELDEVGRDMNAETMERIEGTAKARFAGVREEDGVRVAVLEIELDIETGASAQRETEQGTIDIELTIERELEGEILWDLENDHLVSAELEGSSTRSNTRSGTLPGPEGDEVAVEEVESNAGTIRYSATVERE